MLALIIRVLDQTCVLLLLCVFHSGSVLFGLCGKSVFSTHVGVSDSPLHWLVVVLLRVWFQEATRDCTVIQTRDSFVRKRHLHLHIKNIFVLNSSSYKRWALNGDSERLSFQSKTGQQTWTGPGGRDIFSVITREDLNRKRSGNKDVPLGKRWHSIWSFHHLFLWPLFSHINVVRKT